jgi:hypothetical protein
MGLKNCGGRGFGRINMAQTGDREKAVVPELELKGAD